MKVMVNHLLVFTYAPKHRWLVAALYALIHTVATKISNGEKTPCTYKARYSDDISFLLCSRFYGDVYCLKPPKNKYLLPFSKEI